MANLHYVGMLKEIIIVSYTGQHVTLMKCTWILVHTQGNATNVQQDEHGFFVVNHMRRVNANLEPYVLLAMVSQVWFNHDHNACKHILFDKKYPKLCIYEGWPHLV
jgi:hypothetical protein